MDEKIHSSEIELLPALVQLYSVKTKMFFKMKRAYGQNFCRTFPGDFGGKAHRGTR